MLFTNNDLKKIIVPLLIEQFLAVTIGMLDSMMVSSAGEAAVSGVSLVDSVNLLISYIVTALASGGAVTISQFIGAKNDKYANKAAKQLMWVVLILSAFIMSMMLIFRNGVLSLVFGSIEADVMANAQIYSLFTVISYPFLALYNSGAAIFRAMGNSKISMKVSLAMNVINLFGNALLIFGFHLGAAGAAIATLFSRVVGACIMSIRVCNKNLPVHVEKPFSYKPDFNLIKRICAIGIPNGAENGMFQFGKVITQSLISSFGTIHIAANAAAGGITSLQYTPGGAIGVAMIIVIGRCIGAGEREQAKIYARKLLKLAYILMASLAIIMAIFSKQLVGLYNLSPESSRIACQLVILHCLGISLVHPTAFCLTNSFRAANDVRYTLTLSIMSMWIFRVGFSYILGKYMGLGVIGVWFAMQIDWIFRAICYGVRFVRGTWLTKYKAFDTQKT